MAARQPPPSRCSGSQRGSGYIIRACTGTSNPDKSLRDEQSLTAPSFTEYMHTANHPGYFSWCDDVINTILRAAREVGVGAQLSV